MTDLRVAAVRVPFQDLTGAYRELSTELDAAYQRCMRSGWYVLGTEVAGFEAEYARFCEADHCIGVGNGLDALRLALLACDVGPGDDVLVPSNTFIATWLAVSHVGARIVPVEPDPDTHLIDAVAIAAAMTDRTKAVIPVNLYGQPCDYDAIGPVVHARGARVIADSAQSHGATYRGRRVGGIADIECHSFYPTKNLGAFGDAGAITTNDPVIAERIDVLRNYGSRTKYENETVGHNSRLDELQAALLRVKLTHLDEWIERRRSVAQAYTDGLAGLEGLVLPDPPAMVSHVWHQFVVRCRSRDDVRSRLDAAGVDTLVHYPVAPHLSEAYEHLGFVRGDLPVAEQLADEVLSLPMSPFMTADQVERVIEATAEVFGG